MGIKSKCAWTAAAIIPLLYLLLYTPYGMDTTDFGYFYGYAWRILNGQVPYRDFYYIKPAFPLYWHAFWMWLTPEKWQILGGKAGFLCEMLASSWLAAIFLRKLFKLNLPVALLATTGFVFSIHTFPHMPWHTADGALFCAFSLFCAASGLSLISGISIALAALCKQSFILAPLGIAIFLWLYSGRKKVVFFATGLVATFCAFFYWLWLNDAWASFRSMTTGQLDMREAIDAGILIYLRQNWLLPVAALIPWLFKRKNLPRYLSPPFCYLFLLTIWYLIQVSIQKTWIGFGSSWPTLFMLLGAICVLVPGRFLLPYTACSTAARPSLLSSAALGSALLVAWSCAISGGYKIPAFFATPLVFSFLVLSASFGCPVPRLTWTVLLCGLIMFGAGYQYPYVFPQRHFARSSLNINAGDIYKKASGVKIDADMATRLVELKQLREKYGEKYKTLPGFTLSYYLNGDKPQIMSDWLIDWEINGDVDTLYNELVDKNITVFMERDQLDTKKADAYERAGYTVPQRVREKWRIVEETPHFVIFQPPD